MINRSRLVAFAAAMFLVACDGHSYSDTPSATQIPSVLTYTDVSRSSKDSNGHIYVGNFGGSSSVTVYNTTKNKLIDTVTNGVDQPAPFVNVRAELYVANYRSQSVTVYQGAHHKLVRTLTRQIQAPRQVAFDPKNNAYVLTDRKVLIFPDGRQTKLKSIKIHASAIATDPSGNLYVANDSETFVFKSGQQTPFHTITKGLIGTIYLLTDNSGDLFAANFGASGDPCGSVTVYNTANWKLTRTITNGICSPNHLAIASDGTLFVLNEGANVVAYPPGTSTPSESITQGLDGPSSIAVDENGTLYVANRTSVTVYASGETTVMRTITNGINQPSLVTYGP
jgi:DNA-binding beta-propeller fold protein YncE